MPPSSKSLAQASRLTRRQIGPKAFAQTTVGAHFSFEARLERAAATWTRSRTRSAADPTHVRARPTHPMLRAARLPLQFMLPRAWARGAMYRLTARALRLWRADSVLGQSPARARRPPHATRGRAAHLHPHPAERPERRLFAWQSVAVQRDGLVATPRFLADLGSTSTVAMGGTGLRMFR